MSFRVSCLRTNLQLSVFATRFEAHALAETGEREPYGKPIEKNDGRLQGTAIGCAPSTHVALTDAVLKHAAEKSGALDIGALLMCLRDQGFDKLLGVGLDETRFAVEVADFLKVDLNQDFAHEFDRTFSLITATDVIEHLDSPRDFITETRKLLKPDGLLTISFPNIAFWEGRLKFLLKGEHGGFGEKNYRKQRHISPMTWEQSRLTFAELGFDVLQQFSAGSFAAPPCDTFCLRRSGCRSKPLVAQAAKKNARSFLHGGLISTKAWLYRLITGTVGKESRIELVWMPDPSVFSSFKNTDVLSC